MADGVGLSDLERRILAKLGEGKGDVQIANELAIPFDDAKRGVQSVMRKLGVATREEAAGKGRRRRRWIPRMDGLVHWIGDTRSGQATVAGLVIAGLIAIFGVAWFGGGDDGPSERVLVAQIGYLPGSSLSLVVTEAGIDEPLMEMPTGMQFLGFPRFSPDGTRVAAGAIAGNEGDPLLGRMVSFHVANITIQVSDPVPRALLNQATWSPDGTRFATGSGGVAIFDEAANLLGRTEPSLDAAIGASPQWSSNSLWVALAQSAGLILATRDGETRQFTADELAQPAPAGIGFDPATDRFLSADWDDDGRLRVVFARPIGDRLVAFEAAGFVRGTEVGWTSAEMQPEDNYSEAIEESSIRAAEIRRETATLLGVPETALEQFEVWASADGSAMVQMVPSDRDPPRGALSPPGRMVVFADEPIVVELRADPDIWRGTPESRNVDVVVVR